ncbi:Rossmann-fold NAD(P)-binding domain-containing protein [Crocinitomix catalasitica]|uniref:hypothetical protein n=1 Tax=Crocinitomix catalasitica TaxID=184607 RepID=UPI0004852ED2|nr:hypothetical protein [Crocinitomix catalasitica]
MKKIGILKETELKKIVALTPANVKLLDNQTIIYVESGAGQNAGFTDTAYVEAGATIISDRTKLIEAVDIIVTFSSPVQFKNINKNITVIGFFDCLNDFSVLLPFKETNVDLFSLNFIPRSSIAQSMDILSTIASIAGYQAVLRASSFFSSVVPMITSAGGTLPPANFLVIGAGVAGLQAIATAKRLGGRVKAFDIRRATKTEVESLGASFIEIPGATENEASGGYAVEQDPEYLEKLNAQLAIEIGKADMIITTAQIPGKRAPILIKKEVVKTMKQGSVIVDLAASNQGNCELTEPGEIVIKHGVTIDGRVARFAEFSVATSTTIGQNFTSFIQYLLKNIDKESDEILTATKVISNGQIIHPRLLEAIEQI